MVLRLTDLNGNLVLIPLQKVRFISVKRFMKKEFTVIHLDDYNWIGGTYNVYVKETISEVSLQLSEIEIKSLRVRLSDGKNNEN